MIPALFLVHLASYYSKNYAGILASPLKLTYLVSYITGYYRIGLPLHPLLSRGIARGQRLLAKDQSPENQTMKVKCANYDILTFDTCTFILQTGLILCLLSTLLVPGLATGPKTSRNAIALKRYQTAQSTAVQARGCGTVSDELCSICLRFAVETIDVLLNIILSECIKSMSHTAWFDRPRKLMSGFKHTKDLWVER